MVNTATTLSANDTDFSLKIETQMPSQMDRFPRFRYMGSKYRLMHWLHESFVELRFDSCFDAFCGGGSVSYLLKSMGKRVICNDSLNFPCVLASATVANSTTCLDQDDLAMLLSARATEDSEKFIQNTFRKIFYTPQDLRFLDDLWVGIRKMESPLKRSIAISAALRSCVKRQPRGLFTVAGDPEHYKDGRRDLELSLRDHFLEQVTIYNRAVFSNGKKNQVFHGSVFDSKPSVDLVYFDPPYVPRSDDNCYVKRYHFIEGLSCYWRGKEIVQSSKVKKIVKPFTPFSYKRTAVEAFDRLFKNFADSIQVLSYSSNGYPDLEDLTKLMRQYKRSVHVVRRPHRYHFGTHSAAKRNKVEEFLIIGLS